MVGGPAPITVNDFFGMYIGRRTGNKPEDHHKRGPSQRYERRGTIRPQPCRRACDLSGADRRLREPPQMPAQVSAILGNNYSSFNGLWRFTSDAQPGMWNAPSFALQPRFGIAYRISDKTRCASATHVYPCERIQFYGRAVVGDRFRGCQLSGTPFFAWTGFQNTAPLVNGRRSQTISNPYPAKRPCAHSGKAGGTTSAAAARHCCGTHKTSRSPTKPPAQPDARASVARAACNFVYLLHQFRESSSTVSR